MVTYTFINFVSIQVSSIFPFDKNRQAYKTLLKNYSLRLASSKIRHLSEKYWKLICLKNV